MTTRHVTTKTFARQLQQDLKKLQKKILDATHKTALAGISIVRDRAPVAFGPLAEGVIAERTETGSRVRSTAPYSEAVELGSRPHMPPIEPILAWVRLRGMQGLEVGGGGLSRHPERVAAAIRAHGNGSSTPIDAAERVAWAIAMGIKKNGTKPTWFMGRSVPQIEELLDGYLRDALAEDL